MDTPAQLFYALGFVVGAIALSLWQKLDLTVPIMTAVGRSILQMIVFCYFIAVVFSLQSPIATIVAGLALLLITSLLIRNQIQNSRINLFTVILAVFVSSAVTIGYTEALVIPVQPWYAPNPLLPLLGVLLSSTLGASTIAANQFISTLTASQTEIETHLSLGATPEQVILPYRKAAIRSAMLPQTGALTVLGLGILPNFMAGELLAGANPLQAGAYQVLLLVMSLFATLLTTLLLTVGISRQFLTKEHQFINR